MRIDKVKNKTYKYYFKLTKDELRVLDQSLYEYYSLLADKYGDEDVSMMDEYWTVYNRIKNMVSKINESDGGL